MQTQELPGKIGEKIPAGLLIYNCPKHGWEYGIHCFEATYPENRELWFIYLYGGIKALTDEQYGMLQSELQQGKRIFPFRFDPSELAELASIRTKLTL